MKVIKHLLCLEMLGIETNLSFHFLQMRLVEDNPSSISLLDIYKQRCAKKGLEHDNPIAKYYEKLATVQARGSQASQQVPMSQFSKVICLIHHAR
jgi:hypothetical protein